MKLKDKYNDPSKMVDYKLDTHDGQFSKSSMSATVAGEIAQRADKLSIREEKGYELCVNGEMLFPIDIFEVEDGEIEEMKKPRKSGRPTHAELVDTAGKTMTNPQLYRAIEDAKQEKAERAEKRAQEKQQSEG